MADVAALGEEGAADAEVNLVPLGLALPAGADCGIEGG